MRILLKFRRYFKNFVGFSKILGVCSGILEDSWRILKKFRVCPSVYGIAKAVLSVIFVIYDNIKYGAIVPK